jgi:peptide/nickel transport system substrate-binding protein
MDTINLDPANMVMGAAQFGYETLFRASWTVDRAVYPFKSAFTPAEYYDGELAERWEQTGPTTAVVYIRQGVHWSDKEPTNGRELTAEDIQFNWDRTLGTGSGFSVPNPFFSGMVAYTEKVEAIDRYTVQFTFKKASAIALYDIFAPQVTILAPEWVDLYGSSNYTMMVGPGGPPPASEPEETTTSTTQKPPADWTTAVATGPYELTDFMPGSSMTLTRNPNYYLADERYPQNQLPYIETVKTFAIPDTATALASLRTGKIDRIPGGGRGGGVTWQQVQSMQKTNPEVNVWWIPTEGPCLPVRVDRDPFTDIKVRQALQMSIDRATIASTHYGGTVDGVPCGLISPTQVGWCLPYDKWPTDVQEVYSYNPTKAKELLAEAGYPDGFDTDVVAATSQDLELLQIIKSYFMDIGVNMEINTMDDSTKADYVGSGRHDQLSYSEFAGGPQAPWQSISVMRDGDRQNAVYHNDPYFNELYEKILAATDMDDAKALVVEADMYFIKQCWMVITFPIANPALMKDYVKGFSGEYTGATYSRFWIDKD